MPGIDACLDEIMTLPGARGAAIVDWTSGLALGTAGESPGGDHETTATETAELARAAAEYPAFAPTGVPTPTEPPPAFAPPGGRAPGGPAPGERTPPGHSAAGDGDAKGPPVEDLIVTNRTGYHVLRFVETTFDSSVFLHLWLDRDTGNLALARLRLQQLAERLVLV
ncbi:hypothetical protein OG875_19190 [Streptomyces sp. NBC_01498]|uniref:hypothetical protein n=1 Tax=Streptomyces sp. NBC_01498 TaxID=2975870 RepID=UPI002E7B838C|nr:hypothetical protein [Streptomyces sp. NBC_01498]WTL26515.1 hypothetical protein OG875_19190 [Streptomyces sp. NBC_01498]